MNKLPKIFHNNDRYITNNKKSFNSFEKVDSIEMVNSNSYIDLENLYEYFNKNVVITLKNGNVYSGVLISKRDNKLLLDSSEYIKIDEILKIN